MPLADGGRTHVGVNHAPVLVTVILEDDDLAARVIRALDSFGTHVSITPPEAPVVEVVVTSEGADLRSIAPSARRVTLGRFRTAAEIREALSGGSDGVVRLEDLETTLAPTVIAVQSGQLVVPRDFARRLVRPALSTREKQILAMVVLGFGNGEIARKLFIAESTVKAHLSSSFRKLGVRSRNEATDLILDPEQGLGTGVLAISEPATTREPGGDPA